ncbi:zinc metalloprotease HtpX [bacterium]|nr:zinc metalloprotease HtpX [bacterium]
MTMAMDDMSPQRKSAYFKWRQATQEMQKGHVEKAIDLARTATEEDPTFVDVRLWLARHYASAGDTHRATHELEEVLALDHDHQDAWTMLRQISPAAADRLTRVRSIAPDPFVSQRKGPLSDDLGDDGDLVGAGDEEGAAAAGDRSVGPDPFITRALTDDIASDEGEEEQGGAEPGTPAPAANPAPQNNPAPPNNHSGHPWEYEQDRLFLTKWQAEPVVAMMTQRIQSLWADRDVWLTVLELCAHADRNLHPLIYKVTEHTAAMLSVEAPDLQIFPERCLHPVIIKNQEPLLAVPTGVLRALSEEQMMFQIGREIGHLNTGYLAQMQAVKIITKRRSALAGDLASALNEFLEAHLKYWDEKVSSEDLLRLKRLGHAWQQRCELSADRAGLICCRDLDIACDTLAKTTVRSHDQAALMNSERLLREFEGKDVGSLAAIPVEESPSRNPQYVAYRIHMLRWWAKTPQGKAMVGG